MPSLPQTIPSLVFAILILVHGNAWCEDVNNDWSQFRGQHAGITAGQLPDQWGEADYGWTVATPTADVGSPIIHDGRVVFLAATSPDDSDSPAIEVRCHDLNTGARQWSHRSDQPPHPTHARNSQAASTPAADENGVVYAYADATHTFLVAVDWDGNEVWRHDFGPWRSAHGFGTSPVIRGDCVAMLVSMQVNELEPGQLAGDSNFVTLDRNTGDVRWKTPLVATRTCYGAAIPRQLEGRDTWLVTETGNGILEIDDADGEILWQSPVLEKRVCSTANLVGDLLIASQGAGSRGNALAIRLPTRTPAVAPQVLYTIDRAAPYVPSMLAADGKLFAVDDKGIASIRNVDDGKEIWQRRLGGNYAASPIMFDNAWLALSMEGKASVITRRSPYEVVSQFDIGNGISATPAATAEALVIRVGKRVVMLPLGSF